RLAEDIVADVFGRAYQKWARIGAMDDVNAYVRRMIVNEYTSWWRKRRRMLPHAQLDEYDGQSPDHAVHHAEHEAMVDRLARLPPEHRAQPHIPRARGTAPRAGRGESRHFDPRRGEPLMPTRDDLYGAFALLEGRAPTRCDIPMQQPSLTRRIALPAAAAATV